VSKWQTYDDYIEEDQWDSPAARDEWKPRPVTNICWEKLQTIHGNTATGKVSVTLTERTPGFGQEAATMTDIVMYYWDALDMKRKISEFEWIRPKIGQCVFKSPWNPDKSDGDGDIDCHVVHPGNFFPDPNIKNPWDIQNAEFIDFVSRKTKRWVCDYFSKERDPHNKYTKKQLQDMVVGDTTSDTDIYGTETDQPNQRIMVDLHEYWYKDDDNKLQVAWFAGWVLLRHSVEYGDNKKNGFYKHGRYPVVVIPYIQKDKRFWGRSELQSLVGESGKRDGIQDIINKFDQAFIISMLSHGLGQKAYQHGKVKDPQNCLTGEPDLLIPVKGNPNEAIMHIQGPGPNPQIMSYREAKMIDADRITKQWDITQGRATPAIKTATQTLALKEEAMKGMNDRVETLQDGLRELVEIWIEHLIEFVTTERTWLAEKNVGNKTETVPVTFNPSKLAAMKPRKLVEDRWVEDNGESRRVHFKVKVDIGASPTVSQSFISQLGLDLFGMKAVDIQGLFDMLPDWPGKSDTLERMLAAMQAAQNPEPNPQPQVDPAELQAFIESLPPETLAEIQGLPPEQQTQAVMQLYQSA
jgi:hypothetical protein